ncbi:type III polyketide synthase [Arthrobacter sp. MYb227]|uniref:type III polyketide synthase n=1 Tax=Arthrobacter sp. MYb227 TaxID=1848601 RepID=UPI000CFDDFA5|nr:type III polyketide synthase [Arthrobacter sp. MYb227]PQZ94703.1 type III polyketide synthase [Arthrobacter sp. MYb227]
MPVMMRTIQTALPPTILHQGPARDVFAAQPNLTRLGQRLIATSFNSAEISTRRTALSELTLDSRAEDPVFFDSATGLLLSPSTKVRNEIFAAEASKLFIESARKALEACPDLGAADITHVITVSCTGFYNPGPDYQLVRALGLHPSTQRYHLGFMGCYAAFPGLRAAKSFCEADPNAVVLVVCVELCSLHVRSSNNPDTIMGSAIFADGGAAAIVTARPYQGAGLRLDHFETVLTPVGEESMAWNIGDEGFEMVLGTYVPHIIDDHIIGALEPLLAHDPSLAETYADIPHWGIHPGGRAILDRVQKRLELSDEQLVPARRVLNEFGNMSSATVMFVLKDIMDKAVPEAAPEGERVCAMAFGPGLTVETSLMTVLPERPN